MAAKTSWHGYGTKLRHCHPMYLQRSTFDRRAWPVIELASYLCVQHDANEAARVHLQPLLTTSAGLDYFIIARRHAVR